MMMTSSSFIGFWLPLLFISTLWVTISAAPTTDIDVMVDDPQRTGCLYDGKFYEENQKILTKEPCLNCSCQSGALRCHLQVCPFLHDIYPPPAGCVLVERKNACCPKLHCPTSSPGGHRLLRKDPTGQKAAWKVREDLRKRLVKQLAKSGTEKLGCVESGTLYAEGSAMMTSSTCEYCFCLKGKQTCVKPRCAEPELEGCTPRFRDLACCPTHYDCAISAANTTSVETKKMTPAERRGDRLRPISNLATSGAVHRANDRLIHSSSTSHHQQKLSDSRVFRKKFLTKRSILEKKNPAEEEAVTLGPDNLTNDDPQPAIKPIATVKASNHVKEPELDLIEDHDFVIHNDSLAVEGTVIESRVPAPSTMLSSSSVAPTDMAEVPVTAKSEEAALVVTMAAADEEDVDQLTTEQASVDDLLEPSSRFNEELEVEELEPEAAERNIEVSVSSSISSISQSSNIARVAEKEEDKSKINPLASPVPAPAPPHSSTTHFLPVDNKVTGQTLSTSTTVAPVAQVEEEEPIDYDYPNMELPPSLPNLEIIPFVAADAVMGVPNLEEDERLNLGGVIDQRTPLSKDEIIPDEELPSTEYCLRGGNFYNHGQLIKSQPGEIEDPCKVCRCMLGQIICHETQCAPLLPGCRRVEQPGFCCGQVVCGGNVEAEPNHVKANIKNTTEMIAPEEANKKGDKVQEKSTTMTTTTTTTTTTVAPSSSKMPPSDPLVAFSVTFPPRPTSTLPPQPTSFFRRMTSTRPPPPPPGRIAAQSTTPRTFNNKFNKPAINNLVGVPGPFATGGLRIDSCNIYGQMYRVGRIIDELSGPCVECKCTEIGVNCVNLKC